MATGKQGILGALSGKVANVVCSSWKGVAVFKSLPASVANPRTAAQIAQRTKMANVVAVATKINTSVIKPLWDRFQTQQSGYNAFVQRNLGLFEDVFPSPPEALLTSYGKMVAVLISTLSANSASKTVELTWSADLQDSFAQLSDKVYVVLLDAETATAQGFETTAIRSDASVVLENVKNLTQGGTLYAYLSFKRNDGTVVSNNSVKSTNVL